MLFKKKQPKPDPAPQIIVDLERTYPSLHRFKGSKRLTISAYGDPEHGMENAAALLGDADHYDSPGTEIKLTSFRHDSGSGIKVAVDGSHIGVIWDHNSKDARAEAYAAAYSGNNSGVFVRIERENVFDNESNQFVSRPRSYLFVKLSE